MMPVLKTKSLCLLACLILITIGVMGQENITQLMNRDLFRLYEAAADQEGLFYTPPPLKQGLISNSRALNERRLSAAEKSGNLKVIANTSYNLGTIALQDEDRAGARKHFLRAVEACKESGDEKLQATMLMFLGLVKYQEQEYEKALSYFNESSSLFMKNRQSGAAAYANLMTGQTLLASKDFSRAYQGFSKAFESLTFQDQKARIGVQLAELAIRLHKYSEAEKLLSASLITFQKNGQLNGQAMIYRDRGIIRMKQNEYETAVAEFERSVSFSPQLSTAKLIKDAYLKMFTVASLQGNHDLSNQINITYEQLRDSIDNIEKGRVVSSRFRQRELLEREAIEEMLRKQKNLPYSQLTQQELERNKELTEMELERLEKEKIIEDLNTAKKMSDQASMEREEQIRLLKAQKAEQDLALSRKELEISRQATLRNTLTIGFISLVLVAALLYNRYRTQKKSHLALDKAYTELSETHRKLIETQEQLVHAQKMASLGQLTAGIAHEIQNPLNFVNNFSELSNDIIKEIKEPGADREALLDELASNLEKIHNHGKRADKIVKGMLLHSRTGPGEKQLININLMMDELLELSYHGSRTRNTGFSAEIKKNFDTSLPDVPVIVNDLSRVLVNLFNNSFYAMGEKARIAGKSYVPALEVSTRSMENSLEITIRDNGTGIPESVISKIYDPFFTTKPAGQGTGLGLSLSYDIITKGHSGSMTVASEEGSFTEFRITLPLT